MQLEHDEDDEHDDLDRQINFKLLMKTYEQE